MAQVENAETLTAEVKAELDASAAALDRLEAIGVGGSGGGGGASSAELARLREELEEARAEAQKERERAKALELHLDEMKRAYEEMKKIAERKGFGDEFAAVFREATLDKWLCRKVFERLYADALQRHQRYEERAHSAFWMQTNSFSRCAEQVQQVVVPPRGPEGELLGFEAPIRQRQVSLFPSATEEGARTSNSRSPARRESPSRSPSPSPPGLASVHQVSATLPSVSSEPRASAIRAK